MGSRSGIAAFAVLLTALLAALLVLAVKQFLGFFADPVLSDLQILAWTGALGGLVAHFSRRAPDNNSSLADADSADKSSFFNPKLMLCNFAFVEDSPHIEAGFLASIICGIGGAWGVLFVLAKAMNIGIGTGVGDNLTIVGLGVVAGFSSTTLLRALAKGLENSVGKQYVDSAVQGADKRATAVAQEAGAAAEENATAKIVSSMALVADKNDDPGERVKLLEAAHSFAQKCLNESPNSPEVFLANATVQRRFAEKNPDNSQRAAQYAKAIDLCSDALKIEPNLERAYYNRACYRTLNNDDITLIIADMKKAISILPENKQIFSEDPDIASIRDRPEVKALLS